MQNPQEWSGFDDDVDEFLEGGPIDGEALAEKIDVVIVCFLYE